MSEMADAVRAVGMRRSWFSNKYAWYAYPMNWTAARVVLGIVTVLLLYGICVRSDFKSDLLAWGLCLFWIAVMITDMFDGIVAREFDRESKFGAMADHTGDKIVVNLMFGVWYVNDMITHTSTALGLESGYGAMVMTVFAHLLFWVVLVRDLMSLVARKFDIDGMSDLKAWGISLPEHIVDPTTLSGPSGPAKAKVWAQGAFLAGVFVSSIGTSNWVTTFVAALQLIAMMAVLVLCFVSGWQYVADRWDAYRFFMRVCAEDMKRKS